MIVWDIKMTYFISLKMTYSQRLNRKKASYVYNLFLNVEHHTHHDKYKMAKDIISCAAV